MLNLYVKGRKKCAECGNPRHETEDECNAEISPTSINSTKIYEKKMLNNATEQNLILSEIKSDIAKEKIDKKKKD